MLSLPQGEDTAARRHCSDIVCPVPTGFSQHVPTSICIRYQNKTVRETALHFSHSINSPRPSRCLWAGRPAADRQGAELISEYGTHPRGGRYAAVPVAGKSENSCYHIKNKHVTSGWHVSILSNDQSLNMVQWSLHKLLVYEQTIRMYTF